MQAAEIEAKVRQIIKDNAKLKVPVEEIGLDDSLGDFGISSMNFIKIIVGVEMEFGFEFNNETLKFENLDTLRKIVSFIENQPEVA
ncbi:MAG: acyl carrier protein [Firmicutes bacterium]|nr:acyl carrier protein [Bacillota bacterium]